MSCTFPSRAVYVNTVRGQPRHKRSQCTMFAVRDTAGRSGARARQVRLQSVTLQGAVELNHNPNPNPVLELLLTLT